MTRNSTDDTAEWLTDRDTVETTLTTDDGTELPLVVEDITRDELDALEERAEQGPEAEDAVIREVIREYLVEPENDPDAIPLRKRALVWLGIQRAWSGADEVQAAMDELEVPGNR